MRLNKSDRRRALNALYLHINEHLDDYLEEFAQQSPKYPFAAWLAHQIHEDVPLWKEHFTPREIQGLQKSLLEYAYFVESNWDYLIETYLSWDPKDRGSATWHHWPLIVYGASWKL